MEAFLNELSVKPLCRDDEDVAYRIDMLTKLISALKAQSINIIRCDDSGPQGIDLKAGYTLYNYILEDTRDAKRQLLLSTVRKPFFRPDSKEEQEFYNSSACATINRNGKSEECIGLTAAALHGGPGVNIASCAEWNPGRIYQVKHNRCTHHIPAYADARALEGSEFKKWLATKIEGGFEDCGIKADRKVCNLSSTHHGNGLLADFAKKRLFALPYVVEISTSLEYNPHCPTFVAKVYEDTKQIAVVLHDTDDGYSMLVKTNAKNDVALYRMAIDLEKRFGPK